MSIETDLAVRVIAAIGRWIKQEQGGRDEGSVPRLAFKFCGGCNPEIERTLLVSAVRDGLGSIVEEVSPEGSPNLLVVVNGCATACPEMENLRAIAPAILPINGRTVLEIESGRRR